MAKKQINPGPFILPMPLALIGANVEGKANFMPAAFLGIADFKPPKIACGLNAAHRTCKGIEATQTFSVNLPSVDQVEIADYCGLVSGGQVDKSALFPVAYGELATAPMIESCALSAECKLLQSIPMGVDKLYLGEIVSVFVDESCLNDGQPDWKRINPLLFTFPDKGYWSLGDFVARAWSVGKGYKEKG